MIKDKTTLSERQARSKIKDKRLKQFWKGFGYKDNGELYLKNLQRNCLAKMVVLDNFKIE